MIVIINSDYYRLKGTFNEFDSQLGYKKGLNSSLDELSPDCIYLNINQ